MNKKEYNIKEDIASYRMHNYTCVVCGRPATQIGHYLPERTKSPDLLGMLGWFIIQSRYNKYPVCNLACNKKVQCKHVYSDIEIVAEVKKIYRKILGRNETNKKNS